jgi:bifunctional non-homologous end joining protein LigD
VLLDGEVVALDSKGISRFQLLQRGDLRQDFAVFDCLYRDGRDLRHEQLSRRRRELEATVGNSSKQLLLSRRLAENGLSAYRAAKRKGLEGLLAKDGESSYKERRSGKGSRLKSIRKSNSSSAGSRGPKAAGNTWGHFSLGAYRGKDLHFVGKVGTGFSEETLAALARTFRSLIGSKPPFVDPPQEKDVRWLKPQLVAQIAFAEWTADWKLRQPAFLGLRDDKAPAECMLPERQSLGYGES